MDKAKVNKVVKQIKKIRAESANKDKQKKEQPSKFSMIVSSSPEKIILVSAAAAALSILFDDEKKRRKNPAKARKFHKRFISNYKIADKMIDSTIAAELKRQSEREFSDEKLENMEIENALKFTL